MAQYNFTKEIESNYETTVESTDVMTGGRDQSRFLYYQLKMSMLKAKGIDIIVSFLMESGIRMILNDIRNALDRGVPVRIKRPMASRLRLPDSAASPLDRAVEINFNI